MNDFTRIVRIGYSLETGNIYIKINFKDTRLSITGVEGPLKSGNCKGGCGQIGMGINDEYINNLILNLSDGWSKEKIEQLVYFWKRWHLNDMKAGCIHQRDTKIKYEVGEKCKKCGYRYGHSWLYEEVPEEGIEWLFNLPETNKEPAWV